MGFIHVTTIRSPLQPTYPESRNPRLSWTAQQSHDTIELGNVASKHRTEQVENEIRLKWLNSPERMQIYIPFIHFFPLKKMQYLSITYIFIYI